MRGFLLFGLIAAAVTLAPQQAQQRRACDLQVRATTPGAVGHLVRPSAGDAHWDVGGGVEATCGSEWRVRADSASYYKRRGELYLFGNVEYSDEAQSLVADRATYYENGDWVRSQGNVRLTELSGRSTLIGPVLDYFPANETRPGDRIYAPQRPHMQFYPHSSAGVATEPFDVDADRIHIFGDSLVAGAGRVEAVRGELRAFGDSMHLDLSRDELWLLREPRLEAKDVVLTGDSILLLMEENRVREIQAWPDGSARGPELSLSAPWLRLFVESGEVSRAIAAAGDASRTGAVDSAGRTPWASSESRDYALSADSIDIRRPGGQLEKAIAVRRARANSRQPSEPGGGLLASDWIEGDTITGYFAPADSAATAANEAELRRLVASGNARALYHLREEEAQTGATNHPPLNYVIGRVVILWLEGGEVQEVEVVGPSTGVYLEPIPTRPGADTAKAVADSLSEAAVDTLTAGPPRRSLD